MTTPGPHLTLDELADALAGERAGDPHLRGCAACADRLAELEAAEASVRAQLGALPDPPLPAGLADRLTAALAAEPALVPASAQASATVTPLASRRGRTWVPAAAAAAVLVLGGGLGWAVLSGGGAGEADSAQVAAGGGAVADAVAPVTSDTGVDYGDDAAITAALPQVLAGGAGDTSRATSDPVSDAAPAAEPAPGAATTQEDAGATGLTAAQDVDGLARLRDPAALASCLAALLPPDEPDVRPLALDYAQFQGAPALAVVLPDPDPTKLSVFVVGPECSQQDDRTLRFVRVDRPR